MKPREGKHETLSVRVYPSVVLDYKLQCLVMNQGTVARSTRRLDLAYWLLASMALCHMRHVEPFTFH